MERCEVDPPQAEQEVMQAKVLILSAALFAGLAIGAQAAEEIKGDPKAGEIVFNKCRQCHHIGKGATNFYGPVLNGLIGRPAGTVPGYNYSEANKHSGKVWDVVTLTSYLK
jgi:cytochrome c